MVISTMVDVHYCRGYFLFITVEDAQYCGGCSVMWRVKFSTVGNTFRELEGAPCLVLWRDFISTVEGGYHQYYGGCSVVWEYTISTVVGCSVLLRIPSVLSRMFSSVEDIFRSNSYIFSNKITACNTTII